MAHTVTHALTRATSGRVPVRYWLGNAVWLTFAAMSSQTAPFSAQDGSPGVASILQAAVFSASFFCVAALGGRRGSPRPRSLAAAVIIACAAALCLGLAGTRSGLGQLTLASAAILAAGKACGFCAWLVMLARYSPLQAKLLLALGSAAHIALMAAWYLIGDDAARSVYVFGVCAPVGTAMLVLNVWLEDARSAVATAGSSPFGEPGGGLRRDLALPLVCAVALTLITPIATSAFGAEGREVLGGLVKPLSHGLCLAILAVIWFGLGRDVPLPQLYCASLPLFASVIVASTLASGLGWFVLAIGNGCYFFVSLLMVTTCLDLSRRHHVEVLPLYALFAGCMYLTDMATLWVEWLSAGCGLDLEPYVVALLLLYVVMIPVFVIVGRLARHHGGLALGKKPTGNSAEPGEATSGEGSPDGPSETADGEGIGGPKALRDACAALALEFGLTQRQAEVMAYLAGGRDVSHIAVRLGLSPNTVRSYRKSLYAALGIHGRQELLDLVEERMGERR